MAQMDNLSNRQQQIYLAVQKIMEGEKLKNEGWLEFFQLTRDGSSKTQGGRDVTDKAKDIAKTVTGKNHDQNLTAVLDIITKEGNDDYVTLNFIIKKLGMGWETVKNITEKLLKQKRIHLVTKTRPGSKVPAKCFVLV